jgi:LysM repeat protein
LVISLSAVILLALAGFAWWYFSKPPKEEVTDTVQVEANQEDKNNEVESSDASPTQDKKEDNKPKATETTNPKTNLPGSILKKTKTEEQPPSEEDVLSPVNGLDNGSDDDVITPVENSGDVEENKVKTEPEKTESPKVEDKEEKTKSSDEITPVNKVQVKKATKEYKVKADETYYGIARKFGVKIKDLQELNGNKKLKIGDIILVPVK